jgi:hypothetical protein
MRLGEAMVRAIIYQAIREKPWTRIRASLDLRPRRAKENEMKIKTILRLSVVMTLAALCQLQPRAFAPEVFATLRPSPAPMPDLGIIAAAYIDPNVIVRLKNFGDAPAPASMVAVLMLKKIDADTGKPEAFGFPVPSLSPGQTIQKTFLIGNKAFTSNGALAVVLDYKNQVTESNESNNKANVHVDYLPDLVIQSVEITKDTATVYVFNKCKGSSPEATLDLTTYKTGDKQSGWESRIGTKVPALEGNTGAKVVFELKKWSSVMTTTFAGRYIRVEVDLTNKIKEAVETNNWWETGVGPFPDPANSCDAIK